MKVNIIFWNWNIYSTPVTKLNFLYKCHTFFFYTLIYKETENIQDTGQRTARQIVQSYIQWLKNTQDQVAKMTFIKSPTSRIGQWRNLLNTILHSKLFNEQNSSWSSHSKIKQGKWREITAVFLALLEAQKAE